MNSETVVFSCLFTGLCIWVLLLIIATIGTLWQCCFGPCCKPALDNDPLQRPSESKPVSHVNNFVIGHALVSGEPSTAIGYALSPGVGQLMDMFSGNKERAAVSWLFG